MKRIEKKKTPLSLTLPPSLSPSLPLSSSPLPLLCIPTCTLKAIVARHPEIEQDDIEDAVFEVLQQRIAASVELRRVAQLTQHPLRYHLVKRGRRREEKREEERERERGGGRGRGGDGREQGGEKVLATI